MSETKFTPGEWTAEHSRTWGWVVRGGIGYDVSSGKEIPGYIAYRLKPEANAHLIAAAPDLYAALTDLVDHIWPEDARNDPNFAVEEGAMMTVAIPAEYIIPALAALAKARGEVAS